MAKRLRFGNTLVKVKQLEPDVQLDVPEHDESWVLGEAENKGLNALALAVQLNLNSLIVGPPGTGKSTLVREFAALTNSPLITISVNGELRVEDVIGGLELVNSDGGVVTAFRDGPFIQAAEAGYWLLMDEFDSLSPNVGFLLHGALEKRRYLSRPDGSRVEFHPSFRVFATANTLGFGDDTGSFSGANVMNRALLDRFGVTVRCGYPSNGDECDRLGVDLETASKMVGFATLVREAQMNGLTVADASPRRLQMWANLALAIGDCREAFELAVSNRLPDPERKFVADLYHKQFGSAKQLVTKRRASPPRVGVS